MDTRIRMTTAKQRQQQGRRIPTGMQALTPNMDEDAIAGVLLIEQVFHSPFHRGLTVLIPVNGDHRVGGGNGFVSFFFSHGSYHSPKRHHHGSRRRTEQTKHGDA